MYKDIIKFAKLYKDMDAKTVKTQIRKKRQELEYTTKEVARRMGITTATYQQLEKVSYNYKPSLESLLGICCALHLTLFELMDMEVENNGDKEDSTAK